METLVKAIAEFFAAILGLVGFVGRPRRRANIREDLALVTELANHQDFGRGSWPHQALMNRVAVEVGLLAGVEMKRRKIPWLSVVIALIVGALFAYWTFKLNQDGFEWYSLFPGVVALLMAMALLGMLLPSNDEVPAEDEDFVVHPLAGDINADRDLPAATESTSPAPE